MSMASVGATAPPPEGFRVGNVLSRAIGLLSRHVALFVLVTAAAQLPGLVLALFIVGAPMRPGSAAFGTVGMVGIFVGVFLVPITQTVVYHGAFQDMLGRPIRFGDSLALALRRFFPILGALICMGFLIMLGFVLLVVPGIIAATMLAVTIPVCVVERLGPFGSIGRSAHLTKGHRWRILGIGLLVIVASLAAAGLTAVLRFGLGAEGGALINFVLESVLGAFTSVIGVVMYHELRVAREGLDTDRIAAVFD
jgi:hypothetical protein